MRAGKDDSLNPFLNDELVRRVFLDMGQVASHGTFVNLFLNGAYKGYYNPVEPVNAGFLQTWHGGGQAWDIIEQFGIPREGTLDEWVQFQQFMDNADFTIPANYLEASRRFDLVNFVDYLLLNIYTATGDWPFLNWRAARERVPGAKWRFYVWDAEWSFGYVRNPIDHNEITNELALVNNPIGKFYTELRTSPEFRLLFADRAEKHFSSGAALSATNVSRRYEEMHRQLLGVIPTMNAKITNEWVLKRQEIMFQHMADTGLLTPVVSPFFDRLGGQVPSGFRLTVIAPQGEIYFTTNGVDPRVLFSGQVAAEASLLPNGQAITLNRSVTIKARARSGANWSALKEATFAVAEIGVPIRIVEMMYHPVGSEAHEFLELQNVGGSVVDLGGMSFDGIDFRFADNTLVQPGERLLLASGQNAAAFASRYPGVSVFGYYDGALANGGEAHHTPGS